MSDFTKFTSGFKIGDNEIGIAAAKVDWEVLAALSADSKSSETSGIMTPDQIQLAIASKIAEPTSFEVIEDHNTVTEPKTNVIYLEGPKASVTGDDKYEEWIYTNDEWTKIGDTSIDLKDYVTSAALEEKLEDYQTIEAMTAYAKTEDVPSVADFNTLSGKVEEINETIEEIDERIEGIDDRLTETEETVAILSAASGDYATKAYSTITVNGVAATAANKADTFGFEAGEGITLSATTSPEGHPIITINGTPEVDFPEITGTDGVVAEFDETTNTYSVSGVAATTAEMGMTKASYYDENDGLIHLF